MAARPAPPSSSGSASCERRRRPPRSARAVTASRSRAVGTAAEREPGGPRRTPGRATTRERSPSGRPALPPCDPRPHRRRSRYPRAPPPADYETSRCAVSDARICSVEGGACRTSGRGHERDDSPPRLRPVQHLPDPRPAERGGSTVDRRPRRRRRHRGVRAIPPRPDPGPGLLPRKHGFEVCRR